MHPLLEVVAHRSVSRVVRAQQFAWHWKRVNPHHHPGYAAAEKVPEVGYAVGVDDGHIQHCLKLFAHRIECHGHTAGFGLEQVPVG